jgi:uncharacterized Zn-binding protein involved in type VI secretion
MPPAARKTDPHKCGIPQHGINIVAEGCGTVQIESLDAARKDDPCACGATISKGSATVEIEGKQAARIDVDPTSHGGTIQKGATTVIIGDTGQGDAMKQAAQQRKALIEMCGGS